MSTRTVQLDDLVTIVGGGTPSKARPEYFQGDTPWVSPKDMKTWNIFDSQDHITDEAIRRSTASLIQPGAVLVVIRSGVLKHTLPVAINRVPVTVNQDLKALICSDRITADYLARALQAFSSKLLATVRGTTADNISTDVLRQLLIPVPPLPEQRRIAGVLEQADRLRRTRRYALELSDSFLPAPFRQLFGDPIVKRERWPAACLTELIRAGDKINYGVVQPGTETRLGVPIVRVADMDDLDSSLPHLKRVAREIDEQHSASRLKGDEILIACVGATLGKIVSARPSMKDFNIARAVARVPADWTRTSREFLSHYLLSPKVQSFWLKETRTVGQPTLNITQIEETPVVLPPLALQQQFAALVARHERLRAVQREALRQAEQLFQSLLHRAFTTGL